jgi:hypothetical protein
MLAALGRGLRTICVLLAITLALLVVAEWIARRWVVPAAPADVGAERAAADTYAGDDWPAAYFEEFARANRTQWRSWVYWRRQPFSGRFINIDARGVRRTWRAPDTGAAPRAVYLFGGSTMWGTGARDDGTIASLLARALAERGVRDVEVTNFGEGGYVSMQDAILLQDEIRRGARPAVVVFLDGVNDLFAAYQSGIPGLSQNEANRVREFNIDVDGRIYREALSLFIRQLALFQWMTPKPADTPAPWTPEMLPLAEGAVRVYLGTIDLVQRLAESRGFTALFYWQPIVFTKARPTAYEKRMAEEASVPRAFYERSYTVAREALVGSPVRDLSGVFGDDPQPVYIDFCHLGERGNAIIAEAIAGDVATALDAGDSAAPPQ